MSGWEIAREVFQTIVVTIATIVTVFKGVLPVWERLMKFFHIRNNTWPLKVVFKSAKLMNGSKYPTLEAVVLLEPRKTITLGKCKIVCLLDNLDLTPMPTAIDYNFQVWEIGKVLDNPRTYTLEFYALEAKIGHEVQIQIASEGYECKSNIIIIT